MSCKQQFLTEELNLKFFNEIKDCHDRWYPICVLVVWKLKLQPNHKLSLKFPVRIIEWFLYCYVSFPVKTSLPTGMPREILSKLVVCWESRRNSRMRHGNDTIQRRVSPILWFVHILHSWTNFKWYILLIWRNGIFII